MKDLVYPRERVLGAITLVLGLSGWLLIVAGVSLAFHQPAQLAMVALAIADLRPGVSLHSLGTDRASERQRH